MSRSLYGLGGMDATKPFNNMVDEHDDETRTYHDYSSGKDVSRPYTDDENAAADHALAARAEAKINAEHGLGLHSGMTAARKAAKAGCVSCADLLAQIAD